MGAMKALAMQLEGTLMWHELEPHEKNLRVGMVLSDTSKLIENMLEMGWTVEKIFGVILAEIEEQTGGDNDRQV